MDQKPHMRSDRVSCRRRVNYKEIFWLIKSIVATQMFANYCFCLSYAQLAIVVSFIVASLKNYGTGYFFSDSR